MPSGKSRVTRERVRDPTLKSMDLLRYSQHVIVHVFLQIHMLF